MVTDALFAVDGIDVAGLVAEHLGPRVLDAVLLKPGPTPERDPEHLTRAPLPATPAEHPCRGLIEDFSPVSVDGTRIEAGDRKVILLGGTLRGVVPEGGVNKDQVRIEGGTWNIHRVLARDPAGATYTLQVRRP